MPPNLRMRDVLVERVDERMVDAPDIFFLSADFGSPKLDRLVERFPDRFVNVGIAEQNMVNVAAGLALEGYRVFAYAIAPFISMRAFEQVRVNLSLLSQVRPIHVNLIGVGAGFSYDVSGPTHQALEDLSIMRTLPNMEVLSPSDWVLTRALVDDLLERTGPKYMRLDGKPLPALYDENRLPDLRAGFHIWRQAGRACLVTTGYLTHTALAAADQLCQLGCPTAVVDMFNLSDYAEHDLAAFLRRFPVVVSAEEGFAGRGGLDSLLMNLFNRHGLAPRFSGLGLEPYYRFEIGDRDLLLDQVGLGRGALVDRVRALVRALS